MALSADTTSAPAIPANGSSSGSKQNGNGKSTSGATLSNARAEELIRLMTDGLVNIVDESGEFLLKCTS